MPFLMSLQTISPPHRHSRRRPHRPRGRTGGHRRRLPVHPLRGGRRRRRRRPPLGPRAAVHAVVAQRLAAHAAPPARRRRRGARHRRVPDRRRAGRGSVRAAGRPARRRRRACAPARGCSRSAARGWSRATRSAPASAPSTASACWSPTPTGERTATADVVLDCTGSYGNPNATGNGGIAAPGERQLDERHPPPHPRPRRRGRAAGPARRSWSSAPGTRPRRRWPTWPTWPRSTPAPGSCGRCAATSPASGPTRRTRCPSGRGCWRGRPTLADGASPAVEALARRGGRLVRQARRADPRHPAPRADGETRDGGRRPGAVAHRLRRRPPHLPPAPGARVLRHLGADEAGGGAARARPATTASPRRATAPRPWSTPSRGSSSWAPSPTAATRPS